MAVYNDMTPADIAAVTGNNNRNNGMWGGDWAAWIVLFLIFGMFGWGGMGFGGFGGFGGVMRGANSPGFQGYATRADINEGFALNGIDNGIRSIQNGICDSTYAINTGMLNGFNNLNNSIQQGFNANNVALLQGQNALGTQLADCCCKTQSGIQGVNYTIATQECDTRNQMQQGFNAMQNTMNFNTRDIVENQNTNTRAILDYLCKDKIETLQSENQALRLAASQSNQNSVLREAINASTAEILRRAAPLPVPAYAVANPYTGNYGYGCCGYANSCAG